MTVDTELVRYRTNSEQGWYLMTCRFCGKRFGDDVDWDICDDCLQDAKVTLKPTTD